MRALAGLVLACAACRAVPVESPYRFAAGRALVVAGERVPIEAPVVLWTMEPFYDAYREGPRFAAEGKPEKRYRPGREARTPELAERVAREGWTRANLAEQLDLFVLHYDACGTSQTCFRVLQDERILSVHFLLDLDGTLYQTLDLAETAWHARAANPRSIGIEIAHVGAFPPAERERFERWYEWSESGTRIRPERLTTANLRTREFEARPAREGYVHGTIHGQELVQPDFTPEQYRTLATLARTLHELFPRITLDAPRDATGRVRTDALTDAEEADYHGLIGHFHLQTDKIDPGPAFDLERLLGELRPEP